MMPYHHPTAEIAPMRPLHLIILEGDYGEVQAK